MTRKVVKKWLEGQGAKGIVELDWGFAFNLLIRDDGLSITFGIRYSYRGTWQALGEDSDGQLIVRPFEIKPVKPKNEWPD